MSLTNRGTRKGKTALRQPSNDPEAAARELPGRSVKTDQAKQAAWDKIRDEQERGPLGTRQLT